MFCSFEQSCPPREVRPLDWNLSVVLHSLTHLPYETLELSADKHLIWKTCFFLSLMSAKRVSCSAFKWLKVLHFLFSSGLCVKAQNPSIPDPRFDGFSVLSVDDFVDGDQDELFLCPITALCEYLAHMEQFHPAAPSLFVFFGRRKNRVSRNTISSWLHCVIHNTYASGSDEDCRDLWVRALKVWKFATLLFFKRNCAIHQVLKAGTWSSHTTFSTLYL